jgi:hypothetical protein
MTSAKKNLRALGNNHHQAKNVRVLRENIIRSLWHRFCLRFFACHALSSCIIALCTQKQWSLAHKYRVAVGLPLAPQVFNAC